MCLTKNRTAVELLLASVRAGGVEAVRVLGLRGGLNPGSAVQLVLLLCLLILLLRRLKYI